MPIITDQRCLIKPSLNSSRWTPALFPYKLINMFDVNSIIESGGLLLLGGFIFAEVGLFLGFFLPGDTLVLAAAIYAHQGKLSLVAVMLVSVVAAIAGDSLAYYIGHKSGPRIFKNKDSILFRPDHVAKAEKFFEKHGPKTLLISHYLPVIRTFTPLLAGVGRMPYRKFIVYNVIGDVIWGVSLSLLGYYVGSRIPNIDHYILLGLSFVIVATVLPTIWHVVQLHLRKRRATK